MIIITIMPMDPSSYDYGLEQESLQETWKVFKIEMS